MSSADPSPTSLMGRFGLFVEGLKRAIAAGSGRRDDARAGPTRVLLWNYLGRVLRRLAVLHARFEAGTLDAPRHRPAAPPPASEPAPDLAFQRPGPTRLRFAPKMLARHGVGYFYAYLLPLLEDPEMRALLAASPQAGRLLRPLWRMLTPDPLPEPLRLPPRDPTPRRPPRPRAIWHFTPLEPDGAAAAAPPDTPPPHTPARPRRTVPAEPWVPPLRLPPFSAA